VYVETGTWLILAFIPRHLLDISPLGLGPHRSGLDCSGTKYISEDVPYLLFAVVGVAEALLSMLSPGR
jgi:hypothetical protein